MIDQELLTIQGSATVLQAADKIQRNHLRAVIVLAQDKVIGVCSQGDIVRLLLRGGSPHTVIEHIIQHPFLFLNEYNLKKAHDLIVQHGISIVPVLDAEARLQNIITLTDILAHMEFCTA